MKSKLPHTERKSFRKWATKAPTNYSRKFSRALFAAMKKAN